MEDLSPCAALKRLDEAHSVMVTLIEQGNSSAVVAVLASVLGNLPDLEAVRHDPNYWTDVIVNLNILADALASKELAEDVDFEGDPAEEDWEIADYLDDESASEIE